MQAKKKLEEPSFDVQSLQEELISVKLREAEANLSMKEMRQKVAELEEHWQVCVKWKFILIQVKNNLYIFWNHGVETMVRVQLLSPAGA